MRINITKQTHCTLLFLEFLVRAMKFINSYSNTTAGIIIICVLCRDRMFTVIIYLCSENKNVCHGNTVNQTPAFLPPHAMMEKR